jgi:WD40 repeat protein
MLKASYKGHESPVSTIQLSDSILYSSSTQTLLHDLETLQKTIISTNSYQTIRQHNSLLYGTQDNKIFMLDLKANVTSLIHTCESDINDISLKNNLIAIASDSETIIIDDRKNRPYKKSIHTNIINTIKFRPTTYSQYYTGGYDYRIIHSDFDRHWYEDYIFDSTEYNPPFVCSMDVSVDGNRMCVGLGDGNVGVFEKMGRKKGFGQLEVYKNHSWSVSSVLFWEEGVVSGGIDGKVCVMKGEETKLIEVGRKVNDMAVSGRDLYVAGTLGHGNFDIDAFSI